MWLAQPSLPWPQFLVSASLNYNPKFIETQMCVRSILSDALHALIYPGNHLRQMLLWSMIYRGAEWDQDLPRATQLTESWGRICTPLWLSCEQESPVQSTLICLTRWKPVARADSRGEFSKLPRPHFLSEVLWDQAQAFGFWTPQVMMTSSWVETRVYTGVLKVQI